MIVFPHLFTTRQLHLWRVFSLGCIHFIVHVVLWYIRCLGHSTNKANSNVPVPRRSCLCYYFKHNETQNPKGICNFPKSSLLVMCATTWTVSGITGAEGVWLWCLVGTFLLASSCGFQWSSFRSTSRPPGFGRRLNSDLGWAEKHHLGLDDFT